MQPSLIALALVSGCLRLGYGVPHSPAQNDASHPTVGEPAEAGQRPAAIEDAATPNYAAGGSGSAGNHTAGQGGGAGPAGGNGGAAGGEVPRGGAGGQAPRGGAGSAAAGSGGGAAIGGGVVVDNMPGDGGVKATDLSGLYSGFWGDMVLRKVDAEIWGAYASNDGTIVGSITDEGVFSCWWSETPSRLLYAGEAEFRWSRTSEVVISLRGRWRWGSDGDWIEGWDFERVTGQQAPRELTDRFDTPSNFQRHP